MSDAANNVETKEFSAPELEVLQERMKAYHESVAKVNEWIQFLTKQHNVKESDGWQLGETGFVRQVPGEVATPIVNREKEAQRRSKQAAKKEGKSDKPWAEPVVVAPPEPAPVGANGAHA
jgi:hypothetical protein